MPFTCDFPDLGEEGMTADAARSIWNYDPKSGILTWKIRTSRDSYAGNIAGGITPRGYLKVSFRKKKYSVHRLAWLIMTGAWPQQEIDHKDGAFANNKWRNLRLSTHDQNCQNARLRKDNPTGVKGVTIKRRRIKSAVYCYYVASIMANGKKKFLGSRKTLEEAKALREAAEIELHGEFRRAA